MNAVTRSTADRAVVLVAVLLLAGAAALRAAPKDGKDAPGQVQATQAPTGPGQAGPGRGDTGRSDGDRSRKVDDWFDDKANHGYAAAQAKIEQAARKAADAGAPEEILVERLSEGAAKNADVATLERALQEEAARLAALALAVDAAVPDLADDERTAVIREGAIAMRAGVDAATIGELVRWSVGAGQQLRRTMAALAALGPLQRTLGLDASGDLALVGAMVRSREKPSSFASFASLLAEAHGRGMDARVLVETSIAVLARRGTFLAVRQELDRLLREGARTPATGDSRRLSP